jgi:nickel/cobalt transporter (NicO) family protein
MEQNIFIVTAASLGFIHTILGPDHYLPFIAIAKAKMWNIKKTIFITVLCGIGHIAGSLVLGLIGVFSGITLKKLEIIESYRGNIAAWLLILFGLIYIVYGIRRIYRNKPHKHLHFHNDGMIHEHEHIHRNGHIHIHAEKEEKKITPWVLFIIFVFGPCEVLIPLLMYPASEGNYPLMFLTAFLFGITTILTMVGVVTVSLIGFKFIKVEKMQRYSHALAGALILICGLAVKFLGL